MKKIILKKMGVAEKSAVEMLIEKNQLGEIVGGQETKTQQDHAYFRNLPPKPTTIKK